MCWKCHLDMKWIWSHSVNVPYQLLPAAVRMSNVTPQHTSHFFLPETTSCRYIMWPSSLYNHIYQLHHLRPGLQKPIWRQIWQTFRAIHHKQHTVWSTTSLSKHIVKASLLLQYYKQKQIGDKSLSFPKVNKWEWKIEQQEKKVLITFRKKREGYYLCIKKCQYNTVYSKRC